MRIVALPFAGGNSWSYRPLEPSLDPITVVDYPGHGRRMAEPLLESVPAIARDVATLGRAAGWAAEPFILLGHSMGAQVAAYAASELLSRGAPLRGVVVSGSTPLWVDDDDDDEVPIYELPEGDFLDKVRESQWNTDPLDHPELRALAVPILRADYRACRTDGVAPPPPVDVPVLAICGTDDEDVEKPSFARWSELAAGPFDVEWFPGGHFFLLNESMGAVGSTLARFRARVEP